MARKKVKLSRKETKARIKLEESRAGQIFRPIREIKPEKKPVELPAVISVRDFAQKIDKPPTEVIATLMRYGVLATINEAIDIETAEIVADDLNVAITPEAQASKETIEIVPDANLVPRPPVVAIMGHVDHGKTTLLDYIRKTKVVASESGGITQHIGAYQVDWRNKAKETRKITFLDTPGHAAFATMRAHGATITDIIILVVAADDGVMPQTEEVLDHAKAANVPIVVAVNKIDLPNADIEKVKREMADKGVLPEEWSGDTPFVNISAKTGQGVDDLLDVVLLVSEMKTIVANPAAKAVGVVVEANKQTGRGAIATILIQNGTLHVGESIALGENYGKVRFMENEWGKRIEEAGPSTPAVVAGLSGVPKAGESVAVFESMEEAREAAITFARHSDIKTVASLKTKGMAALAQKVESGKLKELNVILKSDVDGSIDAIKKIFHDLATEEVAIKIVREGVGEISESDVLLAQTTNAMLIGFRVNLQAHLRKLAEQNQIAVSLYDVIYNLEDDLRKALSGLLPNEVVEIITGRAKVLKIFRADKHDKIVGIRVEEGKFENGNTIHVLRKKDIVGEGTINTLKREKSELREALSGTEAGLGLPGYVDIAEDDIVEAFRTEEIKRTL